MFEINELVNTCYAQTQTGTIISFAGYAHLLPAVMMLPLAFFILIKSKFNFFAKTFFAFVFFFCLWLVGDHILWTSNNYDLIHSVWTFLDYTEVVFFVLGLYFILVFLRERDISIATKVLLFILTLPALIASFLGYSTTAFYHPLCESLNSNFITYYKLGVEAFVVGIILVNLIVHIFRKYNKQDKKADIVVMSTIFIMLAGWGVAEYLASSTGNYEIHLYAMFSLPIFVVILVYAIFELDIFHFKILGTYYLVAGLVLLVGGQLFFVEGGIDTTLTTVTLLATVAICTLLFINLRKESEQRKHIEHISTLLAKSKTRLEETNFNLEKINQRLRVLDKMKTEFLSLASHQLRSPLTSIKGYSSMLSDGDFGTLSEKQKEAIGRIFKSSKHLTVVVEDLLNVAKIEQGGMQYVMKDFDIDKVVQDLVHDFEINAKEKNLAISFEKDNNPPYKTHGDPEKLRQVIMNFIDNSIKYTKAGSIVVGLKKDIASKKIIFYVKDTGMGISPEIKGTLFQKFARGIGGKMDATGSGLGLYLAKEVVAAHRGRVWAESEGLGKGSTFFMELVLV
jgi:signal transduction histidine kinase